jgi:hypothetical protein
LSFDRAFPLLRFLQRGRGLALLAKVSSSSNIYSLLLVFLFDVLRIN